jgi:hypothetical protein
MPAKIISIAIQFILSVFIQSDSGDVTDNKQSLKIFVRTILNLQTIGSSNRSIKHLNFKINR